MKYKKWITWVIVFLVLFVAFYTILSRTIDVPETDEEIVRCIGENSVLYIQLGCHACETQEDLFGENYQYLTVVDCFYEQDICPNIGYTPTWIIGDERITGVQSIDDLKDLTGC